MVYAAIETDDSTGNVFVAASRDSGYTTVRIYTGNLVSLKSY